MQATQSPFADIEAQGRAAVAKYRKYSTSCRTAEPTNPYILGSRLWQAWNDGARADCKENNFFVPGL